MGNRGSSAVDSQDISKTDLSPRERVRYVTAHTRV